MKYSFSTIALCILLFLLIFAFNLEFVTADQTVEILIDEDFETIGWGENPDFSPLLGWTTNSFFYMNSFFGSSHDGVHHAFSYTKDDSMVTPLCIFYENTELTFWYAADSSNSPQSIEVYLDSTNLVWEDTDFTNTNYLQVTIDLSSYQGEHFIEFINSGSTGTYGQMIDDILLTTLIDEETSSESGSSDSGSDISQTDSFVDSNQDPIASFSCSKNSAVVFEDILFNASSSIDADGDTMLFSWDFGDGSDEITGLIVSHRYNEPDTYNVVLTVTDGNGRSNETTQQILIRTENSTVPKQPSIQIDSNILSIRTEYWFVISSIADQDQIKLIIDWGDNETTESAFVEPDHSRIFIVNVSHKWNEAGIFKITAQAVDSENIYSNTSTLTVFVDVDVFPINDVIEGYLVDFNGSKSYTKFYNTKTDNYFRVEMHDIINDQGLPSEDRLVYFLIDIDDDGEFEYNYSKIYGLLVIGADASDTGDDSTNRLDDTPGFEIYIFLLAIVTCLMIFRKNDKS